jgi:type II secretory pathway component PulF
MAFFRYQAFSKDGKHISGVIEASSQQSVREQLLAKKLYVISVILQQNEAVNLNFFEKIFYTGLTLKEKIFFTRQLAILLKSGIAFAEALNLMIDQSPSSMKKMIEKMRDELKEGVSFATVLEYFPRDFPPLYIQLVKAGEASGQMEKILFRLASFLEEEEKFNKSVSEALRGPLIQLTMIFIVAGGLLTFIVPKMADAITSMGNKDLPGITKAVLALSNFLLNHYLVLLIIGFLSYSAYALWQQSKSGRIIIDKIKLKIPMINYFTRTSAIVQFSQTLGLLLESGVNIAEALDIVVQIVSNQILVDALQKARDNIIKQGRVTEYLQRTGLFSPVDIHLIETGEQSGSLDTMLIQVGDYNKDNLKEFSMKMTSLLNPISMVILTAVVGTIIFAVMAPVMNMSSMMGG